MDEAKKIRTFIAVKLPHDFHQQIPNHVWNEKLFPIKKVRWIARENLHLTLKFLGDIYESELNNITKLLQQCGKNFSNFAAEIVAASFFPPSHPKVYALILKKNELLQHMATSIENALRNYGFSPNNHTFHPHITLARLSYNKICPPFGIAANVTLLIDNITLFESKIINSNLIYMPRFEVKLQKHA